VTTGPASVTVTVAPVADPAPGSVHLDVESDAAEGLLVPGAVLGRFLSEDDSGQALIFSSGAAGSPQLSIDEDGNLILDEPPSAPAAYHVSVMVERGEASTEIRGLKVILGTDRKNALHGNYDDDIVFAGGGNDRVVGKWGDDVAYGQDGNDRLLGGVGEDALFGGGGRDRLAGGAQDDHLRGGDGRDTLFGGAGDDSLAGDAGNDRLSGGRGSDWLAGGAGADRLAGGAGADIYDYRLEEDWAGSGMDRIIGFRGNQTILDEAGDLAGLNGDVLLVKLGVLESTSGYIGEGFVNPAAGGYATLHEDGLTIGVEATADHAQFVYNPKTGVLGFDADGGGQEAELVPVATLGDYNMPPGAENGSPWMLNSGNYYPHPVGLLATSIVVEG
jgi:Ca2+-binding RTX toxin-like protein